jgi:hypothetical protein
VAAGELIPAGVPLTLADRASRIMLLNKLKPLLTASAVGLLALAVGWGPLTRLVAADPPAAKADPPKVEAAKPLNKLVISRQGKVVLLDGPDANTAKVVYEPAGGEVIQGAELSADGKSILYTSLSERPGKPTPDDKPELVRVMVRDIDGKNPVELAAYIDGGATWVDGGMQVLVAEPAVPAKPTDKPEGFTAKLVDVATKKATPLTVPPGHLPFNLTPDGKWVVTNFADVSEWKPKLTLCLVSRDGKEVTTLTDPAYLAYNGALFPDGKTVLFAGDKVPDKVPEKEVAPNIQVFLQPVGGKPTELPGFPKQAMLLAISLSPDGKKLAYTWRQVHKEPIEEGKPDERETESHLCVYDFEANTHKTVLTEKGKGQQPTLDSVSWR